MEKKVLKFFNKYKIDPNGKDMTALEEKIFDIPISEFTDEILEYLIDNKIAITELSHIELPEKWLVKLIKYDSMPLYRLAYKYYIDDNFSKKKFAEFFRRYLKDSPDIVSTLLDLSEGRLKRRELIELCIESNNNCIRKYGESYYLADYVKNLNDPIKILMCYRENSDNSIIVKEVAKNIFTPSELLIILEQIKKVKDAKSIRILAKENLRRLKKKKCRVRNQETRANVGLETDKHLSVTDSITQEMQVE